MKLNQILCVVVALTAIRAKADIIAFDNAAVAPNQNWVGNLGLDFDVNTPIKVTQFGAFFGNDIKNLAGGVQVAIFDRSTSLQVGATVTINNTNADSTVNGDAFRVIAPITLPIGNYSIVSFLDPNFNQGFIDNVLNLTSTENDGGGMISFVGSGRYDGSGSLDFPTIIDTGPNNRYDSGTFQFTSAASTLSTVPLPASVWGGLALMGALVTIRRFASRPGAEV